MAKGLEKHQERQASLNAFGKELTRRSRSACELCGQTGAPLRIYEVPPVPKEPELERCVFVCETCRGQLDAPKTLDPNHWRCACEGVWSDVQAVQVVSARVLDRLSREELWAREALEQVEFDEETEALISEQPL